MSDEFQGWLMRAHERARQASPLRGSGWDEGSTHWRPVMPARVGAGEVRTGGGDACVAPGARSPQFLVELSNRENLHIQVEIEYTVQWLPGSKRYDYSY